jgi:hypothetical protein
VSLADQPTQINFITLDETESKAELVGSPKRFDWKGATDKTRQQKGPS